MPIRPLLSFLVRPQNLLIYVVTVSCAAMLRAVTRPVDDPDPWWIAAAGREMLSAGAVPTRNLFSFTDPEHVWIMHEWLLGPVYALGLSELGAKFFVLLACAVLLLHLTLLYLGTVARTRNPSAGLVMLLIALGFFGVRLVTARPSGVMLLFPLALAVLAFRSRFSRIDLALCVLIELFWVNAHGSFVLGPVLVTVAALDQGADRERRLAAALAMVLVTLANPYGLGLHRLVGDYLSGRTAIHREIHQHIVEFGSILETWNEPGMGYQLLGVCVIGGLALAALSSSRYRIRAAFCLLLLGAGLLHTRHLELAGLVSCVLLTPWFDARPSWQARAAGSVKGTAQGLALLVMPATAVGLVSFCALTASPNPGWMPDDFVGAMRSVPDGARLYLPFDKSGPGIWYGFPRGVRVFYDARNDCYSVATFRDFMALSKPGASDSELDTILERTRTDVALVNKGHRLRGLLSLQSDWWLVAASGEWSVYRRRAPMGS